MTETSLGPTLAPDAQLILRAIALPAKHAIPAYEQWRNSTTLDAAPYAQHRAFPLLAQAAQRHAVIDADLERLRGVGRSFWARNTLKLEHLRKVLILLETAGLHPIILGVPALIARDTVSTDLLPIDALHILMPAAEVRRASAVLAERHYTPAQNSNGRAFSASGNDSHIVLLSAPLPGVSSLSLIGHTERTSLRGLPVTVPTPAALLFLALAQRSLADDTACLTAALQAYLLLEKRNIDWPAFLQLATRTKLEAFAFAALNTMVENTTGPIPSDVLVRLRSRITGLKNREWHAYKCPSQTIPAKLFRLRLDLQLDRMTAQQALTIRLHNRLRRNVSKT